MSRKRRTTGRRRRWPRSALLVVVLLVAFPVLLFAHLALVESSPASGAELDTVPTEILLTYTLAVEVPVSSVVVIGPNGEIEVGPLESNEGRTVLRAPLVGELVAGAYTVRWLAMGLDGHPVRGEFAFAIEEGAAGLPAPIVESTADPMPTEAMAPPLAELPTFGPQSPLYASVRWMTYVGILGTTGAVGFLLLLLGLRRTAPAGESVGADGYASAAALGLFASLVTFVALPLRLQAQSHALFGSGITGDRFSRLLSSAWGLGWTIQAVGATVALVGFLVARRSPRAGLAIAALGAFALSLSPGVSGHAAAVETLTIPAVLSDGLHVLGAGTWLGTLLALVIVGIPLARRRPPAERSQALYRMVAAFSPIALAAAGVVLATGLFASLLHLQAIDDLWTSGYGRVLAAKLFLVLLVLAAGAYNWRRLRPKTGELGADLRLRRTAGFELVAAALVIALTSVLVAVPPPAEAASGQEAAMSFPDE